MPRPRPSSRSGGVLGATALFWLGQLTAQAATATLFVLVARRTDPSSFGRAATCYGLALAVLAALGAISLGAKWP